MSNIPAAIGAASRNNSYRRGVLAPTPFSWFGVTPTLASSIGAASRTNGYRRGLLPLLRVLGSVLLPLLLLLLT